MSWDPKQHPRSPTGEFVQSPSPEMPAGVPPLSEAPASSTRETGISAWTMLRDEREEVTDKLLGILAAAPDEWIDDKVIEAIVDNAVRARGYDPGYDMDGWETRQIILHDVLERAKAERPALSDAVSPYADQQSPHVEGTEMRRRIDLALYHSTRQALAASVLNDVRVSREGHSAEGRAHSVMEASDRLTSRRLSASATQEIDKIVRHIEVAHGEDWTASDAVVAADSAAAWVFSRSEGMDSEGMAILKQ